MTGAYRIVGVAVIFIVAAIGAVFATDALTVDTSSAPTSTTVASTTTGADTDSPTTTDGNGDVVAAELVPVVPAYYVDSSSGADEPLPPPDIAPDATGGGSGLEVVRPPSGEPTDHPETEEQPFDFDAGPVPIEEIEAAEAGNAADQLDVDELPLDQAVPDGMPAALAVRPFQPPMRFADPCTAVIRGGCPAGLAAIVVTGDSQPELQVSAWVRRGEVGRAVNGTEGCQEDFVEGEFVMSVDTTIPSAIEITYRESLPPGESTVVSLPVSGPGDPEYDRWVENQSNGAFDPNGTWTWFRTCLTLDLEPDVFYEFSPITATSPDGQVVTFGSPLSISTVTPGENIGKPPPTFVYEQGSLLTIHVWKKDRADGYRAFVWPIDLSESEPATCSQVEQDVFAPGGRIGMGHPDHDVASVARDQVPATPHEIYDSEYTWTQQFDMALREGRRYTLCVWETRLGTASFDEWEILGREQYDVVTPNSHPIVMNLVRAAVRGDSNPHDVEVYAENHDFCDSRRIVLGAIVEDVGEATRMLREDYCESWGLPLDDYAFTRISVDDEVADVVALPLDPFTNCGLGTDDPTCALRTGEYIAHTVEIPGSCDPDCSWVDLKFRVDYLPSNGRGDTSWRVGPAGTFAGMEPIEVAGPDVDTFSLALEPVPGRVDQMKATFLLKTPSDYVITAMAPVHARNDDDSCNSTASGSGEGLVEVIMENMCANTQYTLAGIVLTDAEGNTTERDLIGTAAPAWTNGYASRLWTNVSMRLLDEEVAAARCAEADVYGTFSRGIEENCWEYLEVAYDSPVTLGGEQAIPLGGPACVNPNSARSAQYSAPYIGPRTSPRVAVVLGDLVAVDFQFLIEVSSECGSGTNSPTLVELLEVHRVETLDSLNSGVTYTFPVDNGIEWTVRLTRTDVGVANRMR